MTSTLEAPPSTLIDDGLTMVDGFIGSITHQSIVSQSECLDFALDVRQLLVKERQQGLL